MTDVVESVDFESQTIELLKLQNKQIAQLILIMQEAFNLHDIELGDAEEII